ncbi:LysR family transcriptional regulator [Parasphingorhabdus flavimaris]|uniref:LysR family transcriptional regulator n=2 Tax=Parasphingorhabdus flavimaris TaxID=266812 RepID=A0ABX2MZD2_9SPHN|nr:LysR family transcriptional regulator [Parasphingorhabdus flavimaris]
MDTRYIHHFLEVARVRSFAAAARHLDIDPSVISRSVSTLEASLGVRLLQRTTRTISLTEAGEAYLGKISPLLDELEAIHGKMRDSDRAIGGRLCISASVAFGHACIVPHLSAFSEQFPEIDLILKFDDRNVDLVEERVDLAIRLAPSLDIAVIATKLMDTRYRLCASPNYVDKSGVLKGPSELEGHRLISFDLPGFRSQWMSRDKGGEVLEIPISPSLLISNALALKEAVICGLGIGIMADWLVRDEIASGELIDVFPDQQWAATSFESAAWLLYPSRSYLPRKTRVAIDFFRQKIVPK